MRPLLLDLYCGQGGASRGYHDAGFDVRGVDLFPQPRYPYEFVQADAILYVETLLADGHDFVAVHASPPCKPHTRLRGIEKRDYLDLLVPTRDVLDRLGLPYVIENVPGAPLLNAYVLCGGGLGLGSGGRHLERHRLFECHGFELGLVPPCSHFGKQAIGVYGGGQWDAAEHSGPSEKGNWQARGGYQGSQAESEEALGIDWMSNRGLKQAIPPVMTELIGEALLAHLCRDGLLAAC